MKPRFIPDFHDWSGSSFSTAVDEFDLDFLPSARSDSTSPIANAPQEITSIPALASQDIAPTAGPHHLDDSAATPLQEDNVTSQVSEADAAAPEDSGGAAAANTILTPVTTVPVPAILASPMTAEFIGAHATDVGSAIEVPAHDQIFYSALNSIAAASVATATAGLAVDTLASTFAPAARASLANPAPGSPAPVTDSSVGPHGATAAQVQQALDDSGSSASGSGIKVGVISDSFNDLGGAAADEADGALPTASNIDVIKDLPSGGADEGRAMMQVIHDIAPGASLAFYTADESEQDFANGILALAAAGCKVICDDVAYFDEPFFQNGVVAQAIQTVEAEGVTYVTAAGNNASNGYQAAWTPGSGSFDGWSFSDAELFSGSLAQTITVTASSTEPVPLLLEWNQAYGQASFASGKAPDIDLFVFHNGTLIAQATNALVGEPNNPWTGYEFTASGTYQIVVANNFGPDPGLIKEILAGDGLPGTISGANSGTVVGHALTPGVITAGAVSAADTPAFGFSPTSESFSSSGAGAELLFANNGTPLSSPDLLSPVAVSSVDDIATTVAGNLGDFYGTSAASASLAGVAALILSVDPNLTPAQVEQIMEETALPMSNSAVSGAGLVQVDKAIAAADQFVTTVIESFGSTELVQGGSNYFLDSISGGTGPELYQYGAPVVAGDNGGWTPIGSEATASGYEVAWKLAGADAYSVWSTDSNGNYLSNLIPVVSGNSPLLEALESSFHQDLNGDGVIGLNLPTTVIESFGSTSLVEVGSNYFLDSISSGTGPVLSQYGAPVAAGETGGWTPIGAEATAGGYEVAWKLAGADAYSVWSTDSNGNYLSNLIPVVSGNSPLLEALESSFHQDLNGDGVIGPPTTVIESSGSTSLVEVGSNYFLDSISSGTGPELSQYGAPVVAGETGGWTPIGAEATASGYEVAWKLAGADAYSVWSTDSNGNYLSNLIPVVSGSSPVLEALESSFHQDLNGDGVIGLNLPTTVIESFGSTSLVEVGSNYFLDSISSGTGPVLSQGGAPVVAGETGGWTPIGAEATSGGYEVAWKLAGADAYSVWSTDSNGNYLSNLIPVVSGSSPVLEALEPSFHQDLNGDGVIGVPASQVVSNSLAQAATAVVASNDQFVFKPGLGADVIANFSSPATIELDGFASIANEAQLAALLNDAQTGQAQALFQSASDGHDTVINLGNHDSITLMNVAISSLHASNFIIH